SQGGKEMELLNKDIQDWRITFVDTGTSSNIGQRLKAVEKHLQGEEMFLANYADGLCDVPLTQYIDYFVEKQRVASFVSVKPPHSFHVVSADTEVVTEIRHINNAGIRMNGGFFIFRN